MELKIGRYYRYYGTYEPMKLVEEDEFNRTFRFEVNRELLSIPYALMVFLTEAEL